MKDGYVYMMYDNEDCIDPPIYIGKTNDIHKRIYSHFYKMQNGKMDKTLYESVKVIKYGKTNTYADAGIIERYLIGLYQPIGNTQYASDITVKMDVNIEWKYEKITLKDTRKKTSNEEKLLRKLVDEFLEKVFPKRTYMRFDSWLYNQSLIKVLEIAEEHFEECFPGEKKMQYTKNNEHREYVRTIFHLIYGDEVGSQPKLNLDRLIYHPEYDYLYNDPDFRAQCRDYVLAGGNISVIPLDADDDPKVISVYVGDGLCNMKSYEYFTVIDGIPKTGDKCNNEKITSVRMVALTGKQDKPEAADHYYFLVKTDNMDKNTDIHDQYMVAVTKELFNAHIDEVPELWKLTAKKYPH